MPLNPPFDQLLSETEIQTLRALYNRHRRIHPLVSVALHPGAGQNPGQISTNTSQALRYVLNNFPTWARNLRRRLLDEKDWTNAESALAEIRACGALLEAGFPVQLGGKNAETGARAEFHICIEGVETIVEVWTRNLSKNDLKTMEDQQAASSSTRHAPGATIKTSIASVAPFGHPDPNKEGDSILTNIIQRVAGIKEREHQAHDHHSFVLWVDLQSTEAMRFDYSAHLQPVFNWNGALNSGGYWHALYGHKGDVLLEMPEGRRTTIMRHDGRYYKAMKHGAPTRISAFVFSSPETTAIMENPVGPFPLTTAFRCHLLNLPWFNIGLSLANWSDGLVARTIQTQRELITGIVHTLGLSVSREGCLARVRRWIMSRFRRVWKTQP
jgi:hypothetical protein